MGPLEAVTFEAQKLGIPAELALSRDRSAEVVRARDRGILRAHLSGHTVSDIGRALGRDHTTICHALKRMRRRL